jgi:hypothetical protein
MFITNWGGTAEGHSFRPGEGCGLCFVTRKGGPPAQYCELTKGRNVPPNKV